MIKVTVHWIDPATLSRTNKIMSCREVEGSQTGEFLANQLLALFDEHEVREKVIVILINYLFFSW